MKLFKIFTLIFLVLGVFTLNTSFKPQEKDATLFCGPTVYVSNMSANGIISKIIIQSACGSYVYYNIQPYQTIAVYACPGNITAEVTLSNHNDGSIKIYENSTEIQCEDVDNIWSFYPVPFYGNCATTYYIRLTDSPC